MGLPPMGKPMPPLKYLIPQLERTGHQKIFFMGHPKGKKRWPFGKRQPGMVAPDIRFVP